MDMDVDRNSSSDDDIIPRSDEEGSVHEELTSQELIQKIQQAWIDEKLCPELMIPLASEVEAAHDQLSTMESNLKHLPSTENTELIRTIYKLEMNRVKFILTSYLRIRLAKIQHYPWFTSYQEKQRSERRGRALRDDGLQLKSRLMKAEEQFLHEYLGNMDSYLKTIAIDNMPISAQKEEGGKLTLKPNCDKYVFFKSGCDDSIAVKDADGDEEEVDIRDGKQYLMRYEPISHLLHSGQVHLL